MVATMRISICGLAVLCSCQVFWQNGISNKLLLPGINERCWWPDCHPLRLGAFKLDHEALFWFFTFMFSKSSAKKPKIQASLHGNIVANNVHLCQLVINLMSP